MTTKDSKKKWITVRLDEYEIDMIDAVRSEIAKNMGVAVSRNAFLRRVIFDSLRSEVHVVAN